MIGSALGKAPWVKVSAGAYEGSYVLSGLTEGLSIKDAQPRSSSVQHHYRARWRGWILETGFDGDPDAGQCQRQEQKFKGGPGRIWTSPECVPMLPSTSERRGTMRIAVPAGTAARVVMSVL
jgi:hypothetical protein